MECCEPAIAARLRGFFVFRGVQGIPWTARGKCTFPIVCCPRAWTMPLTDTAIRNAKPADKPIRLFDGGGLYLGVARVAASGGG